MVIEFDRAKDAANREKHGVSLAAFAQMTLSAAITIAVVKNDEAREVVLAPIAGRLHVAVITRRGDTIRGISLRSANSRERRRYAQAR